MNCVFPIILLARNDTNKCLKLGLIFKLSDQNFIITNNRSESDHLRDKYVCLNNSYTLGYKKSLLIFLPMFDNLYPKLTEMKRFKWPEQNIPVWPYINSVFNLNKPKNLRQKYWVASTQFILTKLV